MLITLSPTKLQDFSAPAPTKLATDPQYQHRAEELTEILAQYRPEELAPMMEVNPKLALDAYQFIHSFNLDKSPTKQAIFAYDGIAYSGLQPETFTDDDLLYAQEHLMMLSGLYGIIRPLDMIKQYRLEMQTKFQNPKGETLYEYWAETINKYFVKQLEETGNVWVNLTSSEYAKIINPKLLPKGAVRINPVFKEEQPNGSFKQIVVYTKKARGMMAHYILKNKLTDPEDLKGFDYEGYMFNPSLSNKKEWLFTR